MAERDFFPGRATRKLDPQQKEQNKKSWSVLPSRRKKMPFKKKKAGRERAIERNSSVKQTYIHDLQDDAVEEDYDIKKFWDEYRNHPDYCHFCDHHEYGGGWYHCYTCDNHHPPDDCAEDRQQHQRSYDDDDGVDDDEPGRCDWCGYHHFDPCHTKEEYLWMNTRW